MYLFVICNCIIIREHIINYYSLLNCKFTSTHRSEHIYTNQRNQVMQFLINSNCLSIYE